MIIFRLLNKSFIIGIFSIVAIISSKTLSQVRFSDFTGSINLLSNFYHSSGIQRQPPSVSRAIMNLSFNITRQIQIPIEVYLSSQENTFQQPFNQFGINPKISDWLVLHGGYFSAKISDLTFGDLRLLGGGIELTEGNFRLKFLYGKSKSSISPDSSSRFQGIYNQNTYAFCIGYGNENNVFLNLNLFHAIDDTNSIRIDSIKPPANENFVVSANFGLSPLRTLTIKGEVALSAFTNDIRLSEVRTGFAIPPFFFTPRTSSQLDGAAKLNVNLNTSRYWFLSLLSRWIWTGYNSLGYSLLQNDLFEISLRPSIRLFENKVNIKSLIGVNHNNLRNNRSSTTHRFNGLIDIYSQPSESFGLDFQYSNNQIMSSQSVDTVRVTNLLNCISFAPNFIFNGLGGRNYIILNYAYRVESDENPKLTSSVNNKTNIINIVHTIYLPSALSFSTNLLYNAVQLDKLSVQIFNISETVSHNFFNNKLNGSFLLGYSSSKINETNNQFLINIIMSYSLNKLGYISFNLTNNNYDGQLDYNIQQISYNELQGIIQYNLNF